MRDQLELDSETILKLEALLGNSQAKIEELEQKLAIAKEALEYYANRMGMGGTAREALKKIKG